jgi:hypothetical protein
VKSRAAMPKVRARPAMRCSPVIVRRCQAV